MVAATRVHPMDAFGTRSPSKKNPLSALRAAGADFTLRKIPLSEVLPKGMFSLSNQHVVIREDTNTVIGQVGEDYQPFDNGEFFGPVAEQLVEETGAQIERFAMTGEGRYGYMRLSWPEDQNIRIGGPKVGDIVGRRAVLSTSHDGTRRGKMVLEMLRLACLNGMTVPCGQAEFYLTHTRGGKEQLADIVCMVPQIEAYVRQFTAAGDILAATPTTNELCERIIRKVMDTKGSAGETKGGDANLAQKRIDDVSALLIRQPGAEGRTMKDTGWGLFNAFGDYFTHGRRTRGGDATEQRFKSLVPGKNGGAAQRSIVRAWDVTIDELGIRKDVDIATASILN